MDNSVKSVADSVKKVRKIRLSTVFLSIGAVLLAAALAVTVIWAVSEVSARNKAPKIIEELTGLMPEVKNGAFDDRVNTSHAMLEVDGESFIGILELPAYDAKLPVGSSGGTENSSLKAYPRRYRGNIYDGSLSVIGSESTGQFDFMDSVTEYDGVFFTDVMGKRYSFEVTEVLVTDELNEAEWQKDADIVIFAKRGKDSFTVVKCEKHIQDK